MRGRSIDYYLPVTKIHFGRTLAEGGNSFSMLLFSVFCFLSIFFFVSEFYQSDGVYGIIIIAGRGQKFGAFSSGCEGNAIWDHGNLDWEGKGFLFLFMGGILYVFFLGSRQRLRVSILTKVFFSP